MPEIERISALAKEHGYPLHLDGARLWNAVVASGISLKEYCAPFDSASLCFSKGLGAPVGSIVVGTKEFIKRAHTYRKAYGGGTRQAGILAAAALHALEYNFPLLADDHRRARFFAESINQIDGIAVNLSTVQTNLVIFNIDADLMSPAELVEKLGAAGVMMFPFGPTQVRAVFHLHIGDDDGDYAIAAFREQVRR